MLTFRKTSETGRTALSLLVLAGVFVLFLAGINPASAQPSPEELLRRLTAVGNADVRAAPDLAEVRVGVETEAPTAAEAARENATRTANVVAAVRALEIPEQAIQTMFFQLQPIRRFPDEPMRGEPPIVGYRVSNIITVRTERLELAPRIIDESVRAGANRVDGVTFTLRDETAPRQAALRRAVSNARASAQAMAAELGVRLVRLHAVQEGVVGIVPPPILFRGAAVEAAAPVPTPIFPGEITVSASATLTYVIE